MGALPSARVVDDERDVRPLVSEEVIAVALTVTVVVQRLAVVREDDDDRVLRLPGALESLQDLLHPIVDAGDGAVVERAHLLDVLLVRRGVMLEPDRLVVLVATTVLGSSEACVVG